MKKGLKILIAALAICGVVSAYATCYSLRSQYCVTPGSFVGYKTYLQGQDCYGSSSPPVYASTNTGDIDWVNRCITYSGLPDVPYTRFSSSCGAWVHYTNCHSQDTWEWWTFSYFACGNPC